MGRRRLRIKAAVAVILAGGMVFMTNGAGCVSFASEAALGTVDFCFLFDCVDGAIGGLLKPCDDVGPVNQEFDATDSLPRPAEGAGLPLFHDCF